MTPTTTLIAHIDQHAANDEQRRKELHDSLQAVMDAIPSEEQIAETFKKIWSAC